MLILYRLYMTCLCWFCGFWQCVWTCRWVRTFLKYILPPFSLCSYESWYPPTIPHSIITQRTTIDIFAARRSSSVWVTIYVKRKRMESWVGRYVVRSSNCWFSESLWQLLIHYGIIILDFLEVYLVFSVPRGGCPSVLVKLVVMLCIEKWK